MAYVNQDWTARTGSFTANPTIHDLYYTVDDNRCVVDFYFYDFTTSGGAASFTIPLPVSALDTGSKILGGFLVCGFGPSLLIAVSKSTVIPEAVIGAQSITISIPNYLSDGNRKVIVGQFSYSFGTPS